MNEVGEEHGILSFISVEIHAINLVASAKGEGCVQF